MIRGSQSSESEIRSAAERWFARRDAGLNETEKAELTQWLAADSRHEAAYAEIQSFWTQLGQPRRLGAAAAVGLELARLQRRRRRQQAWSLMGATALVACAFFAFRWQETPSLPEEKRIVVMRPERQTLPDGSVLELKERAKVKVDFTATSKGPRRVILQQGEAHFQVTPDADRPFLVTAGAVEVRAVGTAFAVGMGIQSIEVVVTEGRVAVAENLPATPLATAKPAPVYAEAGNRVQLSRRTSTAAGPEHGAAPSIEVTSLSEAEVSERLSWRHARVEFSRTPLVEVIRVVNEHSGIQFKIVDSELNAVPLSGIFRADDGQALARALEQSFDVKVEHRSALEIALLRKP